MPSRLKRIPPGIDCKFYNISECNVEDEAEDNMCEDSAFQDNTSMKEILCSTTATEYISAPGSNTTAMMSGSPSTCFIVSAAEPDIPAMKSDNPATKSNIPAREFYLAATKVDAPATESTISAIETHISPMEFNVSAARSDTSTQTSLTSLSATTQTAPTSAHFKQPRRSRCNGRASQTDCQNFPSLLLPTSNVGR